MALVVSRYCAVTFLTALSLLVLSANFYFVYVIVDERASGSAPTNTEQVKADRNLNVSLYNKNRQKHVKRDSWLLPYKNATQSAIQEIKEIIPKLHKKYLQISFSFKEILSNLLNDLKQTIRASNSLWAVVDKWVGPRQVIPERSSLLGTVLNMLSSTKIIHAENAQRGTQLKLLLTLEGGHKAVFKPQWYSRSQIIEGPVYAGKDRHNAEVAAFHLSLLLGLRRSPLTVGRKINLRSEVMPVAAGSLLDTFYQEGNDTCLYGVCYYCSPQDPVCAHKDVMEGALIYWLPESYKLKKYRHPWQRTYKFDAVARWEVDNNYCTKVMTSRLYNPQKSTRILDLIDAAVFDFLIDNGDRHHYEVFDNVSNSMVLLLDNGKSFGHPKQDHLDILAPLYQCCIIRQTTWERLRVLAGGALSFSMEKLLQGSQIAPVLTAAHLHALDRRLLAVFAAVEMCFNHVGEAAVLWNSPNG
ncbi:glycosaminoglycan xylosylkinase isoform X1 [Schistocerca nitens]|uniref:glycosaminoglycan xylosylkinase isoform X1 n=1 Tax=Schistocerca nitens TaxID=7011 RepID=UPI0021187660|nr:glycosaminoglycan xylosylkinase isoform X1 [Schistocerca nitens]XP_049806096.1 glycosaminoglycan xylosylkinase isoform X1 [Schistocerca nitens]XP_049806097.1 glycosaminoglycan xylosylkinase isoform X1 [Schistocerca nitens]